MPTPDQYSHQEILFDGITCVLPFSIENYYESIGLQSPIPGGTLGFTLPRGRNYGRGRILMQRLDVLKIGERNKFTHTLRLADAYGTLDIEKLGVVRIQAVTGVAGEKTPETIYMLELADQRFLSKYTTIDKAYNYRSFRVIDEYNSPTYYAASLNSGTHWTWGAIVQDIWDLLPSTFGTLTDDGIYPDHYPENQIFRGLPAWEALMTILDITSNVIIRKLDGTFTIVSMSDDQAIGIEDGSHRTNIWNPTNDEFPIVFLPERVRVYIPTDYMAFQTYSDDNVVAGQDAYRLFPLAYIDIITADAIPGIEATLSGSIVEDTITPIHIPRCARYDAAGSLLNFSELDNLATEVAKRFLMALTFQTTSNTDSLHTIYHGFHPTLLPGEKTEAVAWWTGTNGSKTETLLSPLEYNPKDQLGFLGTTMLDEYLAYESVAPPDLARMHEPTERFCVIKLLEDLECSDGTSTARIQYGLAFGNSVGWGDTDIIYFVNNPTKGNYKEGDKVLALWHWQVRRFIVFGPAPSIIYKGTLAEDLCAEVPVLNPYPYNINCCDDFIETTTATNPLNLQGLAGDIVFLVEDCSDGMLAILNIEHHPYDQIVGFESVEGCVAELDGYGVPTGNMVATGTCKINYKYRIFAAMTCEREDHVKTLYAFTKVDVLIDWYVDGLLIKGEYKPIFIACPCDSFFETLHTGTACGSGSGSGA